MIRIDRKRLSIGLAPTPVEHLERLSRHLGGPQIYMKRDDYTGFALGGNKVRKLEFLVAEALDQGADTLVTVGGVQSNHCRQTAAVAARFGLRCHLVLTEGALDTPDFNHNGNVLLDRLTGAVLHFVGNVPDRQAALTAVCDEVRSGGGRPHAIPLGGSSALGSLGYIAALQEMRGQVALADFSAIVVTTGSGGTHAGLAAGLAVLGHPTGLIGISCAATAAVNRPRIAALSREVLDLLDHRDIPTPEIEVDEDNIGEGYGKITDGGLEAIRLCAALEGIFLDPVYTGKAMAGLIGMIRAGRFAPRSKVLFIHTGGSPALFGYRADLGILETGEGRCLL